MVIELRMVEKEMEKNESFFILHFAVELLEEFLKKFNVASTQTSHK